MGWVGCSGRPGCFSGLGCSGGFPRDSIIGYGTAIVNICWGGTMTDDPGAEGSVARPGGVSYLAIPARDVARSAEFYWAVFGWELRGGPDERRFSDGTGQVIGHWRTDRDVAADAGVRPYVYVEDLGAALERAAAQGAEMVAEPYPEGSLRIAVVRDPAGNAVGLWTGPAQPG